MQGIQAQGKYEVADPEGLLNMGECLCFIFLFVLNLIQFVEVLIGKANQHGELAISYPGWS